MAIELRHITAFPLFKKKSIGEKGVSSLMGKATKTIRQALSYQPQHAVWFAANQALFNRVAAFYFEVIQAHEKVLDLPGKEALTALENLTHATEKHPNPVMPLQEIAEHIPAMFRRAAINAALGSAVPFPPSSRNGVSAKRG